MQLHSVSSRFSFTFVYEKKESPRSQMPLIFICIPHCLLNKIAALLHIPFPSERQDFSKSEFLLLHKASLEMT